MSDVVLLGSGMATLGAAYRLRAEGRAYVMFDRGDHPGGHTKTYSYDGGWVFDDGPHVSFTENERIQAILAEQVADDFHQVPTGVISAANAGALASRARASRAGVRYDMARSPEV